MEERKDDLSTDEGLPAPGTEEGDSNGSEGASESGPGNVSVDEPTAAALEGDAGSPGGADEAESDNDDHDDDTSEGTSEGTSSDGGDEDGGDEDADDAGEGDGSQDE